VSELIVLGFKDTAAADKVVPELQTLQSEGLLELADWARVIRNHDGKIDVRQGTSTTGIGAAGGALWGMLFARNLGPVPVRRTGDHRQGDRTVEAV
jgi:uncharacterized membrane protein